MHREVLIPPQNAPQVQTRSSLLFSRDPGDAPEEHVQTLLFEQRLHGMGQGRIKYPSLAIPSYPRDGHVCAAETPHCKHLIGGVCLEEVLLAMGHEVLLGSRYEVMRIHNFHRIVFRFRIMKIEASNHLVILLLLKPVDAPMKRGQTASTFDKVQKALQVDVPFDAAGPDGYNHIIIENVLAQQNAELTCDRRFIPSFLQLPGQPLRHPVWIVSFPTSP